MQLISPRPFQMMHEREAGRRWCTGSPRRPTTSSTGRRSCFPDLFVGVAGLPQAAGEPIENALPELERCVKELGFKGCLLNPDPYENGGDRGAGARRPLLVSALREAVRARRAGAHPRHRLAVRSARPTRCTSSTRRRSRSSTWSIPTCSRISRRSRSWSSHGGGAIPYQLGRFEAVARRAGQAPSASRDAHAQALLRHGALYRGGAAAADQDGGAERCLFGAECPGVGSSVNPETGRTFDDIRPIIEGFDWLTAAQKKMIFEDNARTLFKLS